MTDPTKMNVHSQGQTAPPPAAPPTAGGAPPGDEESMPYALAMRDRDELVQELRDIRSCRSTIFLWTVGTLTTTLLAVWTLFARGLLLYPAAATAMGIILAIYVIGVLALVEKVRAINMREGYVAALDSFLCDGGAPENYRGWTQFRSTFVECGVRRQPGTEKEGHAKSGRRVCPREHRCRSEGQVEAAGVNEAKRFIPGCLNSFTALCCTIFLVMYLVVIALSCVAVGEVIRSRVEASPWVLYLPFVIGFGMSAAPGVLRFMLTAAWRKHLNRASLVIAGFSFGVSMVANIIFAEDHWLLRRDVGWGICAATAGFLLGAFGCYLLKQFRDTRFGRRSFETYFYSWRHVLTECCLLADHAPLEPSGKTSWLRRFFDRITNRKSHWEIFQDWQKVTAGVPVADMEDDDGP